MRIRHLLALPAALLLGALLAAPAYADYTVTGKFQYQDRPFDLTGFTGAVTARPIRLADVRIMAGSAQLATGATNGSGDFSITVPGSTAQSITAVCIASSSGTPGLLLDVRMTTDNSGFGFGDFYAIASSAVASPGSGTVDMGTTVAQASSDAGKAFNIWDS